MRNVEAVPLTAAAFARFGRVIDACGSATPANQGRAARHDVAIDLAQHDPRAPRLHAAVYRIEPSALPFVLTVVERHPLSPQLFFPNAAGCFLACACTMLADGEPDLAGLMAFVGRPSQGFVWNAGVWHAPLIALDAQGDFLMQQWQCGGPEDCEERRLATPFSIRHWSQPHRS